MVLLPVHKTSVITKQHRKHVLYKHTRPKSATLSGMCILLFLCNTCNIVAIRRILAVIYVYWTMWPQGSTEVIWSPAIQGQDQPCCQVGHCVVTILCWPGRQLCGYHSMLVRSATVWLPFYVGQVGNCVVTIVCWSGRQLCGNHSMLARSATVWLPLYVGQVGNCVVTILC